MDVKTQERDTGAKNIAQRSFQNCPLKSEKKKAWNAELYAYALEKVKSSILDRLNENMLPKGMTLDAAKKQIENCVQTNMEKHKDEFGRHSKGSIDNAIAVMVAIVEELINIGELNLPLVMQNSSKDSTTNK